MRWRLALGLLGLMLAMSGCFGGGSDGANTVRLGDGSRISLDLPSSEQPKPDDIRGAISGVVVDDAIFPIPGAEIVMRTYGNHTTADDNGLFSFPSMPPGIVILEAHKDGHAVGLGTVNVHSGQVAKSILQAPRLPFIEPYHTTLAFDRARSAESWLVGDPADVVAFDMAPATVIVESSWPDLVAPPGFDPLGYTVTPSSDAKMTASGTGPNPLRLSFDSKAFPPKEYAFQVSVEPAAATAPIETSGKVFVTIFYLKPAPDGWSFVAGDP